ncbi:hypothetical protein W59_16714 [Rhodococcus opacus RKJ300 = JCM 13270]|uniref:Uncharacterized protein n=1 Tax=Rhodococcus opacus RKJ300 = JCM 13270 TaxID=1165867 RepID=I0WQR2_RHOOP|nr:hypothetical protein W59_16714 [Rhodococcus opacus RKJ300 = JCM 13270]
MTLPTHRTRSATITRGRSSGGMNVAPAIPSSGTAAAAARKNVLRRPNRFNIRASDALISPCRRNTG